MMATIIDISPGHLCAGLHLSFSVIRRINLVATEYFITQNWIAKCCSLDYGYKGLSVLFSVGTEREFM